jgi:LPXTG-motif cell wall-anchored protein
MFYKSRALKDTALATTDGQTYPVPQGGYIYADWYHKAYGNQMGAKVPGSDVFWYANRDDFAQEGDDSIAGALADGLKKPWVPVLGAAAAGFLAGFLFRKKRR